MALTRSSPRPRQKGGCCFARTFCTGGAALLGARRSYAEIRVILRFSSALAAAGRYRDASATCGRALELRTIRPRRDLARLEQYGREIDRYASPYPASLKCASFACARRVPARRGGLRCG